MKNPSLTRKSIVQVKGSKVREINDVLAIEEPLSISLSILKTDPPVYNKSISITMRTPGDDVNLALGFLYTEGIIQTMDQVKSVETADNAVEVFLHNDHGIDLPKLERHFYTTSSCGVCGKTSIDQLKTARHIHVPKRNVSIAAAVLKSLPDQLRSQQSLFDQTGGIHAAALFSEHGKLLSVHEDVGRHNALDKLIGSALQAKKLPLADCILLLSGRASFELIQKASMAGIQIVAAVGAPSSLAVDLAMDMDISLVGFLNGHRFNIYTHKDSITTLQS